MCQNKSILLLILTLFALASFCFSEKNPNLACRSPQSVYQNVKLITFDMFGALELLMESLDRNVGNLLSQRGIPTATINKFINAWASKYSRVPEVNGELENRDFFPEDKDLFETWLRQTMLISLNETGIRGIPQEMLDELMWTWCDLTPRPGALDTLKKLRGVVDKTGAPRFRIGILSNGHTACQERAERYGFPGFKFDAFFGPSQARRFKPHVDLYRTVFQVYPDLTEDNVLHVAGSSFDAFGAKSAGFHALQSNGGGDDWLAGVFGPKGRADCIIDNLTQIPAVIGV